MVYFFAHYKNLLSLSLAELPHCGIAAEKNAKYFYCHYSEPSGCPLKSKTPFKTR
jgi:hypothetical protein